MPTDLNWRNHPWAGVFPASLCPFHEDESIDEEGLKEYISELISVDGVKGVTCNGHTGEVMSLRAREQRRVTEIVSDTVRRSGRPCKVISGISAEGSLEAIDEATAAKEAGADAILLMPPHHWLRFGRDSVAAVGFFEDVASVGIPMIVHQYPAWTKAGYSLKEMLEITQIDEVVCVKMGTREMSRWLYDYEQLKMAKPDLSIVTCHDEFLLPTLLEAADGALIGFAGFVPELMVELVHAALEGDLVRAKMAQQRVAPLARLIYNFGEPGGGAHQRMKAARWLMGRFSSCKFRRPVRALSEQKIEQIRSQLEALGYSCPAKRRGEIAPV